MIATITAAISAALSSIGAFFNWKASAVNQRRLAECDVDRQEKAVEAKKNEIREAVYSNDDEKLNQIVNQLMKD